MKFGQQADLSGDFTLREMLAEGVEQDSFDGVQLSIQLVLHLLQYQANRHGIQPSIWIVPHLLQYQANRHGIQPSIWIVLHLLQCQPVLDYSCPSSLFFTSCVTLPNKQSRTTAIHLDCSSPATLPTKQSWNTAVHPAWSSLHLLQCQPNRTQTVPSTFITSLGQ